MDGFLMCFHKYLPLSESNAHHQENQSEIHLDQFMY